METEAYKLGCDARNDNKDISDNPYDKPSEEWHEWRDGWLETNMLDDEEGED